MAISFCDGSERAYLADIERLIRLELAVMGATPRGRAAAPSKPAHPATPARGARSGGRRRSSRRGRARAS